jgi:uncharacterized protein YkuJ
MVKTSKNDQNFKFVLIPFIQKLQKMVKTSKNAQNFEKWRDGDVASLVSFKTAKNGQNFEK